MPDLWKMDKSRETATLSAKLDASWLKRVAAAEDWNRRLKSGEVKPNLVKRIKWNAEALWPGEKGKQGLKTFHERRQAFEDHWRNVEGVREPSLAWSLNDTFGWHFWAGGLFKVCRLNTKFFLVETYTRLGSGRHLANDVSVACEGYHPFRTR